MYEREAAGALFRLTTLPARQGDALWIEYGEEGRHHRVLVDGGTSGVYQTIKNRFDGLSEEDRQLELVVVTHIDADHIDGIVQLLEDGSHQITINDIWFNGLPHLSEGAEVLGPVSGDRLTRAIVDRDQMWNGGRPFGPAIGWFGDDPAPCHELPGGLRITVLSPTRRELAALGPVWGEVIAEGGLDPATPVEMPDPAPGWETLGAFDFDALLGVEFVPDRSVANATSIVLLAEYEEAETGANAVLLAGDVPASRLESALRALLESRDLDRLSLDAFKVAHHGSKKNISRELVELVDCSRFIFSSNGAYHQHPDREAVARVIAYGQPSEKRIELVFNYRTATNQIWDDVSLMERHRYRVRYAVDESNGVDVELR